MPGVLEVGGRTGRGVGGAVDRVDVVRVLNDVVGQVLSGWQDLGVMGADQVLDELLQLGTVHLKQSF